MYQGTHIFNHRHRGASAISWTLIQGDKKGGFTIFWPDDGLDTGKIEFYANFAITFCIIFQSVDNE